MSEIKVQTNDCIFTSTYFEVEDIADPIEYRDIIYAKKDVSSNTYLINFLHNGKKLKREITVSLDETMVIDRIFKDCKMKQSFTTRSLAECSRAWIIVLAFILFVCGISIALQTGSLDSARVRSVFKPFIYLGFYLGVKVLTIIMISAVVISILGIIISYLQKKEVEVFTNPNHN